MNPEDLASLPFSPAAERNRAPILAAPAALLPPTGSALELASGTGQHAAHFAASLPGWQWQPSDAETALFGAIRARAAAAGLANVAPPLRLDVREATWPSADAPFGRRFELIYAANLLHISPWPATPGLLRGAARYLAPGGVLVVYGPFIELGVPTAPGNLAFDAELRARNPAWGLRGLGQIRHEAAGAGLALVERHALPANNLLLVFQHAR